VTMSCAMGNHRDWTRDASTAREATESACDEGMNSGLNDAGDGGGGGEMSSDST
jgi:hypothetical protein